MTFTARHFGITVIRRPMRNHIASVLHRVFQITSDTIKLHLRSADQSILPYFDNSGFKLYDGHDRSFFFFAYEPRWRQDFVTTTTLFPTAAEKAGDFRNLVRTTSGWVPTNIAAQFGLASNGPSAIYQQFTINNGRLVPIVLRWSLVLPVWRHCGPGHGAD